MRYDNGALARLRLLQAVLIEYLRNEILGRFQTMIAILPIRSLRQFSSVCRIIHALGHLNESQKFMEALGPRARSRI